MHQCFTKIETENASRYLQQLCKHFAHKVAVDYDSARGRVEMPPGLCMLVAENGALSFFCQSREPKGLEVMQYIVVEHLEKFAWREDITIAWEPGLPADAPAEMQQEMDAG